MKSSRITQYVLVIPLACSTVLIQSAETVDPNATYGPINKTESTSETLTDMSKSMLFGQIQKLQSDLKQKEKQSTSVCSESCYKTHGDSKVNPHHPGSIRTEYTYDDDLLCLSAIRSEATQSTELNTLQSVEATLQDEINFHKKVLKEKAGTHDYTQYIRYMKFVNELTDKKSAKIALYKKQQEIAKERIGLLKQVSGTRDKKIQKASSHAITYKWTAQKTAEGTVSYSPTSLNEADRYRTTSPKELSDGFMKINPTQLKASMSRNNAKMKHLDARLKKLSAEQNAQKLFYAEHPKALAKQCASVDKRDREINNEIELIRARTEALSHENDSLVRQLNKSFVTQSIRLSVLTSERDKLPERDTLIAEHADLSENAQIAQNTLSGLMDTLENALLTAASEIIEQRQEEIDKYYKENECASYNVFSQAATYASAPAPITKEEALKTLLKESLGPKKSHREYEKSRLIKKLMNQEATTHVAGAQEAVKNTAREVCELREKAISTEKEANKIFEEFALIDQLEAEQEEQLALVTTVLSALLNHYKQTTITEKSRNDSLRRMVLPRKHKGLSDKEIISAFLTQLLTRQDINGTPREMLLNAAEILPIMIEQHDQEDAIAHCVGMVLSENFTLPKGHIKLKDDKQETMRTLQNLLIEQERATKGQQHLTQMTQAEQEEMFALFNQAKKTALHNQFTKKEATRRAAELNAFDARMQKLTLEDLNPSPKKEEVKKEKEEEKEEEA